MAVGLLTETYIVHSGRSQAGRAEGWAHHLARREAGLPCIRVRTRRTRCTVVLDLSTCRRLIPSERDAAADPVMSVSRRALDAGARTVMWGGHSVGIYDLPMDRADELARALAALADDPAATCPDRGPDYSDHECWGAS